MDKLIAVAIVVAVLVVVFGSWVLAWRARRRRQTEFGELPVAPAAVGAAEASHEALYLATTLAEAPLERVTLGGLGFRARASVDCHPEGLRIALDGRRDPLWIPRERILGAGLANWTIDRASGGDRLVFVRWRLGAEAEVDSTFRAHDPAALLAALQTLTPTGGDPA